MPKHRTRQTRAARTGFPQRAGGARSNPLRPGSNGRSGSHPLLELQRRYGNRYVQRLVHQSRLDGHVAGPTVPALVVQLRERTDQGKGEDAPHVSPQPGTPAEARGAPEPTSAAPSQTDAAGSEPPPRTEQRARAPLRADAGPRTPALAETSAASEDLSSPASGEKAPASPQQDPAHQA